MRNWRMALVPLALSLTVSGCNGAVPGGGEADDRASGDASASRDAVSGEDGTRSFALADFTGVEVTGPDDVTIRRGDRFSITATGPEAELDELEIELKGDRLAIGRKRANFGMGSRSHKGVKIAVTLPQLTAVRLTGSGEVDADTIEGDAIEAILTGSGDLTLARFAGKQAKISLSGSGDVQIGEGAVAKGDYSITGSGDIDAAGLTAADAEVSITGSGNVDTAATGTAKIRILGSGNATLTGGANCSTSKLGSGGARCT